jgi:basic amino acid/polyamine antiporter, APA family
MSDSSPSLKKTLGAVQIAFYGTGSMLGAGIYTLIGKAAGPLGSMVWLGFAVAMVGALLTGLSYAAVGGRYLRAGGAAFVTQEAFGLKWLSYMVGLAVMMSGLTSMATGARSIVEQIQRWCVLDGGGFPDGWVTVGAVLVVGLVGLVVFRGIKESMWLNMLCTTVEAGGLLFIIAVGVRYWGKVSYVELPESTASAGLAVISVTVLQTAVLAFYSFIGFEDILNVSEEVKNPQRDVPRGLISAMLITTCIYMAVAITAVSVVPWSELAQSKSPLMDVARRAVPGLPGLDRVYLAIAIFAIGNTALLNYLMGSRLLYGMSQQGLMPAVLGHVHAVRHTPHVAVVVLFGIVTLLILSGEVKQLAEATTLLLLSVFTAVNLALLRLKRMQRGEKVEGFDVPALVPLLGALVCGALILVRVVTAFSSGNTQDQRAPLVAAGILAVALALYRVLRPRQVV